MVVRAVLAWKKNEDCFSNVPTSLMTLPATSVSSGWLPSVPSYPRSPPSESSSVFPHAAIALSPVHRISEWRIDAFRLTRQFVILR